MRIRNEATLRISGREKERDGSTNPTLRISANARPRRQTSAYNGNPEPGRLNLNQSTDWRTPRVTAGDRSYPFQSDKHREPQSLQVLAYPWERSTGSKAQQECLEDCLVPVPHEVNELDWKVRLSENKEPLIEHLIASANHPDGGCLVFGINDDGQPEGVDGGSVARIANTLANLGRDAVEPCIVIDHGVAQFRGVPLLFVRVPEHSHKPVHRRGKSVEDSWIRSGDWA